MSPKRNIDSWKSGEPHEDGEVDSLISVSTDASNTTFPGPSSLGTYQEIFNAVGFGKWHFLLLAQCGWANASDAIEIMCTSFTMESMKISAAESTWLTVVLFLGMMFGGYVWGSLADLWGRRKVVIYSLAINGFFGAISGAARTYWLLLLLRFFSGFGAGGSLPVVFSYFSEFQPRDKRGAMISALATSWMAGNIFAAGLAWLTLPASSLSKASPYGEQWRFFIILCAIPSLSSSLFFFLMPESPKFLMQKGRLDEAFAVLKQIFRRNKPDEHFPFTGIKSEDGREPLILSRSSSDSGLSYRVSRLSPGKYIRCCFRVFSSIGKSLKHQFMTVCGSGSKARKESMLMMVVYFSIAFGGYGLSMWLPYLMKRTEENSGSPCAAPVNSSSIKHNANSTEMYVDVFIGAAAQLPANIFTILVIDRIGGKIVVVVSLLLSGLSVLFLYLVKSKVEVIIVSAVFNCVSTMVFNGLDVVTPEMYETSVRAAATGLLTALSRVASILGTGVFGVFMDSDCNVPILTVSVVLLIGGVTSIFLPNTRRIELR